MSRPLLRFTALLAALPSAFAQSLTQISMSTGAAVVAAESTSTTSQTASAKPGTTFSMLVTGVGSNATTSSSAAVSSATSAAGTTKTWVISVGSANGSLIYSPDTITGAQVGDQLQFQFYPNNHTATMGDYNNACQPAQNSSNAFFSGFMPTTELGKLTFTVTVKDTNPIWIYCSQGRHCQEGMVAVVNPPATGQTLADYKQRAAVAAKNVAPSSATGGQAASGASTTGATTTGAATAGTASTTSSTSSAAVATKSNTASSAFKASSFGLAGVAAIAVLLL
ncbi:uncharacterized protein PV09_04032 [Verruconis gallopava]|uniref:Phytocyanin domain-containing protein n=1 Tax=Verruconis gallopava TaxID=253628 RepID=A0A0D2AEG2_9PEZI|nr:uncharacterized protein PV09_04032 [Verruconis gallopava]KIW04850.1 hypothetical protein PV09_04032 [Verruconis gallopava]